MTNAEPFVKLLSQKDTSKWKEELQSGPHKALGMERNKN